MSFIDITKLYQSGARAAASVQLHGTMVENRSHTSKVTEYPVEKGFNISDGVVVMPERISLSGIITAVVFGGASRDIQAARNVNNPYNRGLFDALEIGQASILGDGRASNNRDRARQYYDIFREIQDNRIPVGYVSTFCTHKDLIIESFDIIRDVPSLDDVKFKMELKKIITVETTRVKTVKVIVRPKTNVCQPVKECGEQASAPMKEETETGSMLREMFAPGKRNSGSKADKLAAAQNLGTPFTMSDEDAKKVYDAMPYGIKLALLNNNDPVARGLYDKTLSNLKEASAAREATAKAALQSVDLSRVDVSQYIPTLGSGF